MTIYVTSGGTAATADEIAQYRYRAAMQKIFQSQQVTLPPITYKEMPPPNSAPALPPQSHV